MNSLHIFVMVALTKRHKYNLLHYKKRTNERQVQTKFGWTKNYAYWFTEERKTIQKQRNYLDELRSLLSNYQKTISNKLPEQERHTPSSWTHVVSGLKQMKSEKNDLLLNCKQCHQQNESIWNEELDIISLLSKFEILNK